MRLTSLSLRCAVAHPHTFSQPCIGLVQDTDLGFDEYAGGLVPCPCAVAVCAALGVGTPGQHCSVDALAPCLHPDAMGAPEPAVVVDGVLRVHISVCGKDLLALRLADGSWGLVANASPLVEGRPRCLLCSRTHCAHARAVEEGEVGRRESGMSAEAFQKMYDEYIDPSTGRRRVTSVSRQRVPEEAPEGHHGGLADLSAAAVIAGRMSGRAQLPQRCSPSREVCSCGKEEWEEHAPHDCIILFKNAVQTALCHALRCRCAPTVCP